MTILNAEDHAAVWQLARNKLFPISQTQLKMGNMASANIYNALSELCLYVAHGYMMAAATVEAEIEAEADLDDEDGDDAD